MNQKGFGIKEIIILLAVFFISVLIIMSLSRSITNVGQDNETNDTDSSAEKADIDTDQEDEDLTYQDLEKRLELAAERYQNDTYSANTDDTEIWYLSYSMLKEKKYLDKLVDPNDKKTECTGYVEFVQDGAKISYKPFLKCGSNYETEGYDENNLQ